MFQVDSGFVIVGTPVVAMPGGDGTVVKSIIVNEKSVDYMIWWRGNSVGWCNAGRHRASARWGILIYPS